MIISMTYANDDCRNEFTKGQVAVSRQFFLLYVYSWTLTLRAAPPRTKWHTPRPHPCVSQGCRRCVRVCHIPHLSLLVSYIHYSSSHPTYISLPAASDSFFAETDPNVKGNNKPTSDSNSSGNPTGSASKTDSGALPAGTGGARGVARPWMGVVLGVVAGVSWGRWM
jgi:hypothetical protein